MLAAIQLQYNGISGLSQLPTCIDTAATKAPVPASSASHFRGPHLTVSASLIPGMDSSLASPLLTAYKPRRRYTRALLPNCEQQLCEDSPLRHAFNANISDKSDTTRHSPPSMGKNQGNGGGRERKQSRRHRFAH